VRGHDIDSFVAEVQNLIEREATPPAGYYITGGGEFENTQRAMKKLYVVVPLAVLLIFLPLYSTFNLFRYAALIIANVPFALVGGVAAVWPRGFNLSLPQPAILILQSFNVTYRVNAPTVWAELRRCRVIAQRD
jgi:cobalt-zinc-cadmium resistance protein CzcA